MNAEQDVPKHRGPTLEEVEQYQQPNPAFRSFTLTCAQLFGKSFNAHNHRQMFEGLADQINTESRGTCPRCGLVVQ